MSSIVRIEESVQIARSPAEVWEAIADYEFDLQWRSALVEMTPDPPGQPAPGTIELQQRAECGFSARRSAPWSARE